MEKDALKIRFLSSSNFCVKVIRLGIKGQAVVAAEWGGQGGEDRRE